MEEYQFIAHLLDRILIGEKGDDAYKQLQEALEQDAVWEVHFFNKTQEIFAAREGDELVVYRPLMHREDCADRVAVRTYKLDPSLAQKFKYSSLVVKEYLDFDDEGLAYVESTVLYELKRGLSDGEK